MGIYTIKPKFQKSLRPIENFLVERSVHPTKINIFGLFVSIVAALAIYLSPEIPLILLLVPVATTARTACNALDGLVARKLNVASRFGEVLNEFIDRINDSIIFGSFLLLDTVNQFLAATVIITILLNSYLSIVSKAAGGSRQYGGIMGKADRMIYVSISAVVILATNNQSLWNYFLVFILVGTLITMWQRFTSTKEELS